MTRPSPQEDAARAWLESHRGEPLTVAQIAAGAQVSEQTVRRVLRSLRSAARLIITGTWPRGYQVSARGHGGRR
jgi:DNA-binding GntR family transcriptional regulator